MANTYLVVRHGEDTDNKEGILNGHRDTRLTQHGKDQARTLGTKLADDRVDYIYHSPLVRAKETADIIAEEIATNELHEVEDLIERDFGVLAGKPKSAISEYADEIMEGDKITYFLSGPGVETFPQAYKRANDVLDMLQSAHENDTLLLVTHGDIGMMLEAAYHGWAWKKALDRPYFDNTDVLHLQKEGDYIE